ncbi:MAG: radical SAM protein [Coriobacteriales bacterium]
MTNPALEEALASFDAIEKTYVAALQKKGLKFAERGSHEERVAQLHAQLKERGAEFRNAGASIRTGWLSKACVECTGMNGSETFSTTFKCHRDCYFCFNYNLGDYDKYVREGCPWEEELQAAYEASGGKMAVLGLTGGEPLLNLEDSLRFLQRAGELFPQAHKRMYTSGDLLTEEGAQRLAQAGLTEMRFSIKQDDPADRRETVLSKMKMATAYIPDVVVEMPIIPGTKDSMKEWMLRFEENGIKGMNLLEFCFPFHSWDEFEKRGFTLKNPPFPEMFDYGYSGGLAVAGSEELALELMVWALDEGLSFGMHYCSLENKHRSEIRQLNEPARRVHPIFEFDEGDFFVKTAKVFGPDRDAARQLLADAGCRDVVEDEDDQTIAFPPRFANLFSSSPVQVMMAFNVLDKDEHGRFLREVALKPYEG